MKGEREAKDNLEKDRQERMGQGRMGKLEYYQSGGNRYALFQLKHGKRKPGRPKLMIHQYIASVISQVYPPTPEEIGSMVKDRKAWRKLVTDCSAVG